MERLIRNAVVAYSIRNRRRKAALITDFIERKAIKTAVVIGAVGSASQRNESIVEKALEGADVVAALDIMVAEVPWPYVVGDGRSLPFKDGAVDLLVSNAVIEHVGQESDQRRFMDEHVRVGRTWVVTTPNRWFPVEADTSVVFRHWSPKWRSTRQAEFTRLLSLREFRRLLPRDAVVLGHWWSPTFMAFSG